MKIVVICGSMGSGKTTLCQKIIQKNIHSFQKPIKVFSADKSGSFFREQFFSFSKNQWKLLLFFSPHKNRYWNMLEQKVHPAITQNIHRIIQHTKHQKGTLIIDIALPHLLPTTTPIYKTLRLPHRSLYSLFFVLQTKRKMPSQQIISILNKQDYFSNARTSTPV